MKKLVRLVSGMVFLLCYAVSAYAAVHLVRVADNASVDVGRFVEEAGRSDVIFIGDTHDDKRLHGAQLELIRALYAKNPQLAVGLEMFTADNQPYLDYWTNGQLEEKQFAAFYAKNWSYDWNLYRDLFLFIRDNHIPLVALNVPKTIIAKVVRQGAKALSESERKALPPGPPWSLNDRQAGYVTHIREQVFGNGPAPVPAANFNEAQALRNHAIAYNVVKFREKSPQSKVVVIAGTWHAIKNGAPESLKEYGRCTYQVVLPELAEFARQKLTTEDADYLIPGSE